MSMTNPDKKKASPWVGKRALSIGSALTLLLVWLLWPKGSGVNTADLATFEVRRGPLAITVLEGGNIHALNSHEFRSEIKTSSSSGGTKILSLIDEGYQVTDEDVKNGLILVELDSNNIKERIFSQEVEFQGDMAIYAEADEARAIQVSENQSAVKEIRQLVRFALLDFEKYLGSQAAHALLKARELPFDVESLAAYEGKLERHHAQGDDETAAQAEGDSITSSAAGVDFVQYLTKDELGDGAAQQTLRQLQDDLLFAQNELALAEENYKGSVRLAERKFITQTALESELVALEKKRLSVQTARTGLEIFQRYEFSKAAEGFLSDYEEALQKLDRTKRAAAARMAQAEARFRSAERRYQLELKEKEDLEYQLERCIIRAEVPGLVAYGGAETNYYRSRSYDAVTEGAEVRYGQPIVTIPDMSNMALTVNIHESYVKKVAIGQNALVTVEAEPGIVLEGNVHKLAVLPDSANMRYNPNLKVYPASIRIEGAHEWLKPGMTAKVEIVVGQIDDAIYVPVQSVFVENDAHFCYVSIAGIVEKRRVAVGEFNDEFIEIQSGLGEGDLVFLSEPGGVDREIPDEPLPGVETLAGANVR